MYAIEIIEEYEEETRCAARLDEHLSRSACLGGRQHLTRAGSYRLISYWESEGLETRATVALPEGSKLVYVPRSHLRPLGFNMEYLLASGISGG